MAKNVFSLGMIGYSGEVDDLLIEKILSQPRLRLHALHSGRFAACVETSRIYRARPSGSVRAILEDDQIDGVIIANPERLGRQACQLLVASGKPLLVSSQVMQRSNVISDLERARVQSNSSVLMMPELVYQWSPSTLRLRELIATSLGPVREIRTVCPQNDANNRFALTTFLNWCRTLIAIQKTRINVSDDKSVELKVFAPTSRVVRIVLTDGEVDDAEQIEWVVECENGVVRIRSTEEIQWDVNGEAVTEPLMHERVPQVVMLDLFGRRLAGGIIPIPTISEVVAADLLAAKIQDCLKTGESVELQEESLTINNGELG